MDRRCAGLPYIGSRKVSDEERRTLIERYRRCRRRSTTLLAGLLITFIVMFGSPIIGIRLHKWDVMALIALVDMVLFAIVALKWNDSRRPLRISKLCKNDEKVEIYGGRVERTIDAEPELLLLRRLGLDPDAFFQSLERLAPSHVLLTINGNYIDQLLRPAASQIANNASAASTLFPSRWADIALQVQAENRRTLSEEELGELRNHAKALRPKVLIFPTLAVIYGMTISIGRLVRPGGTAFDRWMSMAIIGFFAAVLIPAWIKGISRWKAVKLDADDAFVFITSAPTRIEFLPHSRLVWRRENVPSSWRRVVARDVD